MIKTIFVSALFSSLAFTLPQHGYATFGELKYSKDFDRFDYTLENPHEGGELNLSDLGTFDSLNPFILRGQAPSISMLLQKVHATLLSSSFDEPASSYGYVANSLEVDENFTYCTFYLNKQACFSDNTPITAHDVLFSFNILQEKGLFLFKSYYARVEKAEAIDEHTIRFYFKAGKKVRELPPILGQFPILCKAYYDKHAFDEPTLNKAPTSGPYIIDRFEPGRMISYSKIKNWWGSQVPSQKNQHNFATITVHYYRDHNAMFEAFKSGQVDFRLENISKLWATDYTFDAVKNGDVTLLDIPNSMTSLSAGYFMNLRKPIFQDPLIRKALCSLLDFNWLRKNIFYNLYERSESYFPQSDFDSSAYFQPESDLVLKELKQSYPKDVLSDAFIKPSFPAYADDEALRKGIQHAQELFKQAGYTLDKGILTKEGKPFTFEILLKDKSFERFTLNFVTLLKRAGIQVTIRLVDLATYQERLDSFDYDMVYEALVQSSTPGNELRGYFSSEASHQKGQSNYAGIQNKAIDSLIERIDESDTFEELKINVRALDRLLLSMNCLIPSWHTKVLHLAFWNKFSVPKIFPTYQPYHIVSWAIDPEKTVKIKETKTWLDRLKALVD